MATPCVNAPNATEFNNSAVVTLITDLKQNCSQDLVNITFGDGKVYTGISDDAASRYFTLGQASIFHAFLGFWSVYAAARILARLIDFKLPLLQLISQNPRPRLIIGWKAEVLTILHLVGDPIDSMSSSLFTLATCRALFRNTRRRMEVMATQNGEIEIMRHIPNHDYEKLMRTRAGLIVLMYLAYATTGHPKKLNDLIR